MNPITDMIKVDLDFRNAKGYETYGKPLTAFNGRKSMQDMFEELLDAVQYAKQNLIEIEAVIDILDAALVHIFNCENGKAHDCVFTARNILLGVYNADLLGEPNGKD